MDTFKWEDWLVGEQHVAALADVHIHMQGKRYKSRHLFLVGFDTDDKIVEIVVFFEDEHSAEPVSYTHLDVYKRQNPPFSG